MSHVDVTFRSFDGTRLEGTLTQPESPVERSAVLVHGGGVTRDEGGFYVRLAEGLADVGVASLRFDLRGHGGSAGRQEELTLSAAANDVRAALDEVRTIGGAPTLIGTSFSGGVCALVAAAGDVRDLVLFNPLLDYKRRFVDEKPYWSGDHIDADGAARLDRAGFVEHSPTFRLGRAMLNEVFQVSAREALPRIAVPTLIVHGTKDTFVPIDSSREAVAQLARSTLIELEGAQHGFAVHDDPTYAHPQTREWQALVIRETTAWLARRT
ncbi:alpha/beta hydrolase [Cryptosporangium phraense]|uniref:Lysophospholipase n=1 Tax=Cryptosporangium phraense TaxID=2593070 RepID=A0A545AM34_9ACTN|nr:alpha/beta fold hydrolase [Cryptosporangium phraense]TQS42392.1 lysophospholipase [Cryptosporangium phraense]